LPHFGFKPFSRVLHKRLSIRNLVLIRLHIVKVYTLLATFQLSVDHILGFCLQQSRYSFHLATKIAHLGTSYDLRFGER